jgi:putative endonuclease
LKFYTYILFSKKLNRHYSGSTSDLDNRIKEHNSGKSKYTKTGKPWRLVKFFEFDTRSEAVKKEYEIKKRGCKRYLENDGLKLG